MDPRIKKDWEDLLKLSNPPIGSHLKAVTLYRSSRSLVMQGNTYFDEKDYIRAYIMYMRFLNIVSKRLKKHPDAQKADFQTNMGVINKLTPLVLTRVEKINPLVKEQLLKIVIDREAWELEHPKEEESTGSSSKRGKSSAVDADSPKPYGAPPQSFTDMFSGAASLRRVVVHGEMFNDFLSFAQQNTSKGIETCGILGGKLKENKFELTHVLIPKQTGTTDTVEMKNEEEVFMEMISRDLTQLGWIHTHPNHDCFMSSVDCHTQSPFQTMLPEAIAIVLAPKASEKHGVFALTDPYGLNLIQNCNKRGFHPHDHATSPIYHKAPNADVVWNNGRSHIIDLRSK